MVQLKYLLSLENTVWIHLITESSYEHIEDVGYQYARLIDNIVTPLKYA